MSNAEGKLQNASPLILQCSWGRVEVEHFGWFKDVLLLPGLAEEWAWEESQDHSAAVSIDLVESLHTAAEVVVIGLGMETKLRLAPEVLAVTAAWGPNLFLASTEKAVIRYNELTLFGKSVAMALHSTC